MASTSQSHSHSNSKKRKHVEAGTTSASAVKVTVAESSTSVGPAFVNFPAIRPSKTTPFSVYRRNRESDKQTDFAQQLTLIAGETGDVEYFSVNKDSDRHGEESYACQYLPAIYDPSTNSLHINPSTPTYILSQRVKRLKTLPSSSSTPNPTTLKRLEKRNELGEAFGTRKAKSRIKADERNKVDAGRQEDGREGLMELIEEKGKGMPTVESIAAETLASRLIPPPDLTTDDPSLVYPLSILIPQEELAAISTKEIATVDGDRERMALLPHKSSRWIEAKLRLAVSAPLGVKKEEIKILFYISCIRQFLKMKGSLGDSSKIVERMNNMPKIILDGLIKRFTETSKGSSKPVITNAMEQKLVAYEFALRLMIEKYACEVGPIAADLNMPEPKVRAIFQSLGCTLDSPASDVRDRLGMTAAEARQAKRAILQAPPVFPRAKKGPAKR